MVKVEIASLNLVGVATLVFRFKSTLSVPIQATLLLRMQR